MKRPYRMVPSQPEQLQLWAEARLDGGMVTDLDPVDLENKQMTLALNVVAQESKIYTRPGHSLITPTKPDSNKIVRLARYREFNTAERFVRFTQDKLFLRGVIWDEITGSGLSTITDRDLLTPLTANNLFFFSNGVDVLQEIDFNTLTYADAGATAKKYRYYVPFYNRIVGANLNDTSSPNPIEVGWSGDLNFGEWDPLNDFSAGFGPLIDNPADSADFITGLQVVSDVMLVLRQYSIWTATRVPSATDPFYFANTVPNFGCNAPGSVARIPNGIAYYDERLNNVFALIAGQREPVRIGDPIRDLIRSRTSTVESLRGGYEPVLNQYRLLIPNPTTGISTIASFDFTSGAWTIAEIPLATSIDSADFVVNSFTIDDLLGTIDELQGTIDDLSPSDSRATTFIGRSDGEVLVEDMSLVQDGTHNINVDIRSKLFKLPAIDAYVAQLHLEYIPLTTGSFTVEYSKDGGDSFAPYKTVTFGAPQIGKRLTVVCNKNIRARTFMWRVRALNTQFELLEYSTFVYLPAGFTRQKTS
jgi:hypothetical protein